MKSKLVLLALLVSLSAQAQSTFVNYRMNFVGGVASTNIAVGTNVLVRVSNSLGNANLTGGSLVVSYPGGPSFTLDLANPGNTDTLKSPFLGPCNLQYSLTGTAGAAAMLLLQWDVVNTTLTPQNVIVQPAGAGANITLQTSTNLTTWSAANNGVYSATGQNRFFRMSLALQ